MNIVITGGVTGLGASITRRLASDPKHQILATYCRDANAAQKLSGELKNVKTLQCDFTDAGSVEALTQKIGTIDIDILIHNAFTGLEAQHFHKTDADLFLKEFQSNILPVIRLTQEAIRVFRKKKFGKIITILTSYLFNRPPAGLSGYVAGKAYLASLSKSWAAENAALNITSNCISPSFMKTGLTQDTDERVLQQLQDATPLKKLLEPDEVAACVQFLVNAPQHLNGINLLLNGASDVV